MKHCIYCGINIESTKTYPMCPKSNSTAGHKFTDYNYINIGAGGRCLDNSEITIEDEKEIYKKAFKI